MRVSIYVFPPLEGFDFDIVLGHQGVLKAIGLKFPLPIYHYKGCLLLTVLFLVLYRKTFVSSHVACNGGAYDEGTTY